MDGLGEVPRLIGAKQRERSTPASHPRRTSGSSWSGEFGVRSEIAFPSSGVFAPMIVFSLLHVPFCARGWISTASSVTISAAAAAHSVQHEERLRLAAVSFCLGQEIARLRFHLQSRCAH